MKPTFQINGQTRRGESSRPLNHVSRAPVTDWSFQATAPEMRGGSQPAFGRDEKRSFRRLSEAFLAGESKRDSRLEAGIFVVMITFAAWPIGLAVQAALALVK